jgi:hypothetical protein
MWRLTIPGYIKQFACCGQYLIKEIVEIIPELGL